MRQADIANYRRHDNRHTYASHLVSSGVISGELIVGVEILQQSSIQSLKPSVNYSGPSRAVLRRSWDAAEALAIE
jgi:hypothetical protein